MSRFEKWSLFTISPSSKPQTTRDSFMMDSPANRTSGHPTPRINRLSSSIPSSRLRPAFTGASVSISVGRPGCGETRYCASSQARVRSKHQFPRKWRMDRPGRAEGKAVRVWPVRQVTQWDDPGGRVRERWNHAGPRR